MRLFIRSLWIKFQWWLVCVHKRWFSCVHPDADFSEPKMINTVSGLASEMRISEKELRRRLKILQEKGIFKGKVCDDGRIVGTMFPKKF